MLGSLYIGCKRSSKRKMKVVRVKFVLITDINTLFHLMERQLVWRKRKMTLSLSLSDGDTHEDDTTHQLKLLMPLVYMNRMIVFLCPHFYSLEMFTSFLLLLLIQNSDLDHQDKWGWGKEVFMEEGNQDDLRKCRSYHTLISLNMKQFNFLHISSFSHNGILTEGNFITHDPHPIPTTIVVIIFGLLSSPELWWSCGKWDKPKHHFLSFDCGLLPQHQEYEVTRIVIKASLWGDDVLMQLSLVSIFGISRLKEFREWNVSMMLNTNAHLMVRLENSTQRGKRGREACVG